jgi:fatty acid synthase subunit alpha, fungi type
MESQGVDIHIQMSAKTARELGCPIHGLAADDIDVLSIHGTSTQANEKNEMYMWNTEHNLEDTRPFPRQCHPYHGTEEFSRSLERWRSSMAGLLQSIENRVVPGNCNADNIDALLQQHSLLMFPSKSIQTDGISAGVMVRSLRLTLALFRCQQLTHSVVII